jgi:hypothetical protein
MLAKLKKYCGSMNGAERPASKNQQYISADRRLAQQVQQDHDRLDKRGAC